MYIDKEFISKIVKAKIEKRNGNDEAGKKVEYDGYRRDKIKDLEDSVVNFNNMLDRVKDLDNRGDLKEYGITFKDIEGEVKTTLKKLISF